MLDMNLSEQYLLEMSECLFWLSINGKQKAVAPDKDILIWFCDNPYVMVTLVATSHYFSQEMLITFSYFLRGTNYMCAFTIVYIISS